MTKRKQPQTSFDAYHSLEPEKLRDIYKQILAALVILKSATFEEIAAYMKVDKDRVWKRMSELQKMELVYRPGGKKKLRSGRDGYLWSLTFKGSPTIQEYSKNIQSIAKQFQQLPLL